jgi:hypothetical protein
VPEAVHLIQGEIHRDRAAEKRVVQEHLLGARTPDEEIIAAIRGDLEDVTSGAGAGNVVP